jgi:hypothetical protein
MRKDSILERVDSEIVQKLMERMRKPFRNLELRELADSADLAPGYSYKLANALIIKMSDMGMIQFSGTPQTGIWKPVASSAE